jgi:hypothetical protein
MVDGDGFEKLTLPGDLMTLFAWTEGLVLLTTVFTDVNVDGGAERDG